MPAVPLTRKEINQRIAVARHAEDDGAFSAECFLCGHQENVRVLQGDEAGAQLEAGVRVRLHIRDAHSGQITIMEDDHEEW